MHFAFAVRTVVWVFSSVVPRSVDVQMCRKINAKILENMLRIHVMALLFTIKKKKRKEFGFAFHGMLHVVCYPISLALFTCNIIVHTHHSLHVVGDDFRQKFYLSAEVKMQYSVKEIKLYTLIVHTKNPCIAPQSNFYPPFRCICIRRQNCSSQSRATV